MSGELWGAPKGARTYKRYVAAFESQGHLIGPFNICIDFAEGFCGIRLEAPMRGSYAVPTMNDERLTNLHPQADVHGNVFVSHHLREELRRVPESFAAEALLDIENDLKHRINDADAYVQTQYFPLA